MNALPGWPHAVSPWHAGETALQQRVGADMALAEAGRRIIRGAMPVQHQELFAQLPFVVLGAADAAGQPWATVLSGAPGFVHATGEDRLHIDALPAIGDPLHRQLTANHPVALLGIELHTRRRNRANGLIVANDGELDVQVRQSFGNCPQYIHTRLLGRDASDGLMTETGTRLDGDALRLVQQADTFFVATQALPESLNGGADVSHRGGPTGFVQVDAGGTRLAWPDYRGNRFFNTLGNIELQPRTGLLFIDFARGGLLHIAGDAEIVWSGDQRHVLLHVREWRLRRGAWPFRSVAM